VDVLVGAGVFVAEGRAVLVGGAEGVSVDRAMTMTVTAGVSSAGVAVGEGTVVTPHANKVAANTINTILDFMFISTESSLVTQKLLATNAWSRSG
jgi:hypothetical protein